MKSLRALKQTIHQIFVLAKLSSGGPGWKFGIALCGIILAASLADVYIGTLLINWNKTFFDALQRVDVDTTLYQIVIFFLLRGASATLFLIGSYVRKLVFMQWRQRLNGIVLDAWLTNKTYWRLQTGIFADGIDNPDQRISEDCRFFVDELLEKSIALITRVVALVTYLWVLWSLSSYSLEFSIAGWEIIIPHYMVWMAFIYVAVSTGFTHLLGAPLKNLLFTQQQREADYRFSLSRVRNSIDPIALANGENAERRTLDYRFGRIIAN